MPSGSAETHPLRQLTKVQLNLIEVKHSKRTLSLASLLQNLYARKRSFDTVITAEGQQ
jgi:hypothetical protein